MIAAQKAQAEAMRELSAVSLRRQEQLAGTAAASREQLDAARASYERDRARVDELTAAARGRAARRRASDEIDAAEAAVAAAQAALAQAEWRLERALGQGAGRGPSSPTRSTARASRSPPARRSSSCCRRRNVKLRFFVPEPLLGALAIGER